MCISSFIWIFVLVAGAGQAETPVERVLLRRNLTPDAELVVVRGNEAPGEALAKLKPEYLIRQTARVYDVRVELHSTNAQPIVLGTILLGLPKGSDQPKLRVIELAVREGELVLVLYSAGELWAHRWDFSGKFGCQSEMANLEAAYWSMNSHPAADVPENIDVKLSLTQRETWHIEVAHRVPSAVRYTTFDQVKGSWEFRVTNRDMVRRTESDGPATNRAR